MRPRKPLTVGLGIALLTLLGSISAAQAQYAPQPYYPPPPPPPPPHGVYRSGLVYGFSVGVGSIGSSNCGDACGAAGLLEFHIGGMINPRTALLFEVWGADHPWTGPEGDYDETTNSFLSVALQYWVTDLIWVKGGVGAATLRLTDQTSGLETDLSGFGIWGAAGLELIQSYNFALDLQLRIGNGFYSQTQGGDAQNYALMVGFNWY
jgi:hypothetical protein